MISLSIGRVLLASLASFGADKGQQDVLGTLDFPALAKSYLETHGLKEAPATLAEILDGPAYARIELGAFDLRYPVNTLHDAEQAQRFQALTRAYVDLQAAWFAWRDPAAATAEHDEDWKTLGKWVKAWQRSKLTRAVGGKSLYETLGAPEEVLAAAQRLRDFTRPDETTIQDVGDLNQIVFAPTRRDFIELLAIAGSLDEKLRPEMWHDRVLARTVAWHGWTQFVAMEYTQLPADPNQPFIGVSMNEKDSTGQVQYMVERGAALLLRKQFYKRPAHFFEQTLATNLVIATVGKNDLHAGEWKLEYQTSGSSTQPYERFVPGGNPAGGTLPARKAGPGIVTGSATVLSLYRKDQGADHFIASLREGQKAGAKLAAKDKSVPLGDDKLAHFEIVASEQRGSFAVTAPFMGQLAEGKKLPPNEFLDDYEDFFRAYRSAFFEWLRDSALETEEASHAKFAQLLEHQASADATVLLDDLVLEVYGTRLSHDSGAVDSMEWRFLNWLGNNKRR